MASPLIDQALGKINAPQTRAGAGNVLLINT
jgi:hypothetical protein